jgi:hypothetical protein
LADGFGAGAGTEPRGLIEEPRDTTEGEGFTAGLDEGLSFGFAEGLGAGFGDAEGADEYPRETTLGDGLETVGRCCGRGAEALRLPWFELLLRET